MATAGDILQITYNILNESSTSPFISSTYSYALLNEALKDIYLRTNLITKEATISVTSGTNSYSLPDDFYSFLTHDYNYDICVYRTDTTPSISIKYVPYDEYKRMAANSYATSSSPSYFSTSHALSGSTLSSSILLYPTPSANMTITITYIPEPPTITSDSTVIPLPDDLSLPLASFIAFLYKYRDRDPSYGDHLYQVYETGIRRYMGRLCKTILTPRMIWTKFR